ncbi:Organic hydroperoxide resistance protein OhrA [Nocardioides sp. T2.26MG-1]|nr:Organic hydroperoxide resistance protein OhrA [Nocardioides sp. T2.26MG-1]
MPPEMGGPAGATNPEQLFAAGYAACFHSALRLVAGRAGVDVSGTEVVARDPAARAHQICPYSNATRGNIEVTLAVA